MAFKSVIKQNKVVDDNNVNQLFLADNTEDYYDWQALKIAGGEVAPVDDEADVVFWICCCDRESDTLESDYKINARQPRTWDTFLIKTDFDLADANVGTYYGIIPELDSDSNPTGWYLISTTWTQPQWRLITVLWERYGEFEFERKTVADAVAETTAEALDNLVTSWDDAPDTTPEAVWLFFVDTTHAKLYVSTWTTSSSDWTILN